MPFIYIPTYGRVDTQITLSNIPKAWHPLTRLVVYDFEAERYIGKCDPLLILPCDCERGIGHKRQWIMDNAEDNYPIMFDDDLQFFTKGNDGKLRRSTDEDFTAMIDFMHTELQKPNKAQVGLGYRSLATFIKEDHKEIGQVYSAYAFNAERVRKTGLRFDYLPIMEDTYMTLALICAGYPNTISWRYVVQQKGVGAVGGCSIYRDYKLQNTVAQIMVRTFPGIVKTYVRKTDLEFRKCELKIAWRKAYKSAIVGSGFRRKAIPKPQLSV